MRSRLMVFVMMLGLVASVVSAGSSGVLDAYNARANQLRREGFVPMYLPVRGDLRDGASTTWTLTLQAGIEYRIFGVCDEDCGDLDMVLYDNYGRWVDDDLANDEYPMVVVTPLYTRSYSFKVTMADCWYSPCAYMVGVFGRQLF